MRKKEKDKWLRRKPQLRRKVIVNNPAFSRAVNTAAIKKAKEHQQKWRKQWKTWVCLD
jgi:hypothetical protein